MSTTGQPDSSRKTPRYPSLRVHVEEQKRLNSGEFLRSAEKLRELTEHPGWPVLLDFVGVQVAFLRAKVDRDPVRMATSIASDPTAAAVKLALAGGEAEGLGRVEQHVLAVLAEAAKHAAQIEEGER